MVDLQDPEVRRMLTELVTFEIDQAADFRRRGQTIDAVLQLTEAEKVSRALGMTDGPAHPRDDGGDQRASRAHLDREARTASTSGPGGGGQSSSA